MKKVLTTITAIFSLATSMAQDFSFQLFFRDAAGNKDTITLGYDLLATDSIDASFGETNIISTPLNSGLDVRITNEWRNRSFHNNTPGTFHTKKQITFHDCANPSIIAQSIDIYTQNWPVTAIWNSSLFSDPCRDGSVFTSIVAGGWWDTGSPSNLSQNILKTRDSITFSSNIAHPYSDAYSYIKGNDTIPVFWQAFGDRSTIINISVQEPTKAKNNLKVFPNPVNESFSIEVSQEFGTIENVQIISLLGQSVMVANKISDINISKLSQGLYLVLVTDNKGNRGWTRIIKE